MEKDIGWRDWGLVALLMGAGVFSMVDRVALSMLLEAIKADLKLSDVALGLLNGVAFGIFYSTMGVPLGWLADRWSRKGTIIGGIAVWSAATAACGLAGSYIQLLVARICVGAGEASLSPAAYSMVHDRFPRRRLGTAISLIQVGSLLGGGVAIFAVGFVYAFVEGLAGPNGLIGTMRPWQLTFVLVALPGIFFIILFLFVREDRQRFAQAKPGTKPISIFKAFARARAANSYLLIGMSGIALALYSLSGWTPAILMREFGWSAVKVGSIYGILTMTMGPAGAIFGGWLCDKLEARGVTTPHGGIAFAAAAFALPCFIAMGLSDSPTSMLIAIACAQFAISVPNGLGPALIQLMTPNGARGQMSAVYVMTMNLMGLGIGPVAVGFASQYLWAPPSGLRYAVAFVTSLALICSIVALRQLTKTLRSGIGALPADDANLIGEPIAART